MTNKINKYALISVYDKKGIFKLAGALLKSGYKIIATDGTGKILKKHKIPFMSCQKLSKSPNCFDGCMKTMSFAVESGMFFDRQNPIHVKEAKENGVKQIDMVVCNFFPVKKVIIQSKRDSVKDITRKFDFGGPTMVRVAAQNFKNVMVVVDTNDYKKIITAISLNKISEKFRHYLAIKAFKHISDYDMQVLKYLNEHKNNS